MNAHFPSFSSLVKEGAASLGLDVAAQQVNAFCSLCDILLDWNNRMNLTAVKDPADIAVKHVLDSMTLLSAYSFPEHARVIDVGTGAGFPGLVLKVMRSDLDVTLLDSTRKKLQFVDYALTQLGLAGATTVFGRAEEIGREATHREAYDVAVARAVAPMRILSELCLPLVRAGGMFLAMKGPNVTGEIPLAERTIHVLGGHARPPIPFALPFGGGERAIVPIRKERPTPALYPRLYRDIRRQPIT